MIFLDTSVLVAVAQVSHQHHKPSLELWNGCSRRETAISAHTLAELYNTLTGVPPALRLRPRDAMLAIETFLKRTTPIALTPEETVAALKRTAEGGLTGGIVYDALLLECARKCDAESIYTWNLRHFRAVAPDLAERMITP